jgi:hypothetical protein
MKQYPYVTRSVFAETEGVNDVFTFNVTGVGKDCTQHPYVVVNEWIAANIAQYLRLPVPPFGIFWNPGKSRMFGSINFKRADSRLVNVNAGQLWKGHPRLVCGIVIFDIFIVNSDRHIGNIKVDKPTDPKEIHVFDHDRAIFGSSPGGGIQRLRELANRLGVGAGSASGGSKHCLLDIIDDADHFQEWIERIGLMPNNYINDLCEGGQKLGASRKEINALIDFLCERKEILGDLISQNKSLFPSIANWQIL